MAVLQGTVQIDMDQQDYLGVLLGDPTGFGSSAASQALQAAPASNTGTLYIICQIISIKTYDHRYIHN